MLGIVKKCRDETTNAPSTMKALGASDTLGYRNVHVPGIEYLFKQSNVNLRTAFEKTALPVMLDAITDLSWMFTNSKSGKLKFAVPSEPKTSVGFLVPPHLRRIPSLWEAGKSVRKDFSAVQVFALLSHAFLVGDHPVEFQWKKAVGLQFKMFFNPPTRPHGTPTLESGFTTEKLNCFFAYFIKQAAHIAAAVSVVESQKLSYDDFWKSDVTDETAKWNIEKAVRIISYCRNVEPNFDFLSLKTKSDLLSDIEIHPSGEKIEDFQGVQMDFADKSIGGLIMKQGCVQEEIRFLCSPELLLTMMIEPLMQTGDSISVFGCMRSCSYVGYAGSFRYSPLPADDWQGFSTPFKADMWLEISPASTACSFRSVQFNTQVGAINATNFRRAAFESQFENETVGREIRKVLSLLNTTVPNSTFQDFAFLTGNWGCGIFKGDPQLKCLLQWIGCSLSNRTMHYFPFGETKLQKLKEVVHHLKTKEASVGQLVHWMEESRNHLSFEDLLKK